jgi:hypothetical protein
VELGPGEGQVAAGVTRGRGRAPARRACPG